MQDLYEILGVKRHVSKAVIKVAYKKLASKYHPDRNPDAPEATAKFQTVQRAYDILSDDDKRKHYDETGSTGDAPNIDQLAVNMVGMLTIEAAAAAGFRKGNYLLKVRQKISEAKVACAKEAKKYQRNVDRLTYLIDHTKSDGQLDGYLDGKRMELQQSLAHAEEGLVVMDAALDYIEACSYTGEEDQEVTFQRWSGPTVNISGNMT